MLNFYLDSTALIVTTSYRKYFERRNMSNDTRRMETAKSRISEALKFIFLIYFNESKLLKMYVPEHCNSWIR